MFKGLLGKLSGGCGWWALWAVAFLAAALPLWSFYRSKIDDAIEPLRYPWGLTPAELLFVKWFRELSGYLLIALLAILGAAIYRPRFQKPLIAAGAGMTAGFLSLSSAYLLLVLNMYLKAYTELRDDRRKPLDPARGDYLLRSGEDGTWRAQFTDGEKPAFTIELSRHKPVLTARVVLARQPGVSSRLGRDARIQRVSDGEVHFRVDWQAGMQDSMVLRLSSPLQSDSVSAVLESTAHPGTPIECELVRVR
jgi:hypothetical protein